MECFIYVLDKVSFSVFRYPRNTKGDRWQLEIGLATSAEVQMEAPKSRTCSYEVPISVSL